MEEWFIALTEGGQQGGTFDCDPDVMAHLEGKKRQSLQYEKEHGAGGADKNKG
jgi:hypothetical protein